MKWRETIISRRKGYHHGKTRIASSGSLATDLGLPDAEETDIKAKLAARLSIIIQERGHSQTDAAQIIGTDQAKVSAVLNGQFRGFSIYRLMTFLKFLDQDVEIVVRPKVAGEAHLCVVGGGDNL